MMRELRLTYPHILAADCAEGALWCESDMNAADHGSRGRKLAMPAPRRAWVHDFFEGNVDALDRRVHGACGKLATAAVPEPQLASSQPTSPRLCGVEAGHRDGALA